MLSKVKYVSMIRLAHNVIDLLVQNLLDMDMVSKVLVFTIRFSRL